MKKASQVIPAFSMTSWAWKTFSCVIPLRKIFIMLGLPVSMP